MAEEKKVEQIEQSENSKTLVSFVVGLLIGGMLVWAFSGGEGKQGDGAIAVSNQKAGLSVALDSATYPVEEGWIGVRDYNNGQLSFIKGVVRFSAAAGRVPESIPLQAPTIAGEEYAVVVFTDNGDNAFNTAGDVQIDQIFATFTAE